MVFLFASAKMEASWVIVVVAQAKGCLKLPSNANKICNGSHPRGVNTPAATITVKKYLNNGFFQSFIYWSFSKIYLNSEVKIMFDVDPKSSAKEQHKPKTHVSFWFFFLPISGK